MEQQQKPTLEAEGTRNQKGWHHQTTKSSFWWDNRGRISLHRWLTLCFGSSREEKSGLLPHRLVSEGLSIGRSDFKPHVREGTWKRNRRDNMNLTNIRKMRRLTVYPEFPDNAFQTLVSVINDWLIMIVIFYFIVVLVSFKLRTLQDRMTCQQHSHRLISKNQQVVWLN